MDNQRNQRWKQVYEKCNIVFFSKLMPSADGACQIQDNQRNDRNNQNWIIWPADKLIILGFVIGFFAAIAIALLFYCIARFLADPIMYRIDLRYDIWSPKAEWLKRGVMAIVILLYCGTMVFAGTYEKFQEDQYVWLVDNEGTYHRVDKTDYEKVRFQ